MHTKPADFHTSLVGYLQSKNHGMIALMFDGDRDLFRFKSSRV